MATVVPKKSPLDIPNSPAQQNATGIGVSFPFNGGSVFNTTFQTRDQIRTNLINYLLTNNNERVFNPDFGADLRRSLFDIENQSIEDIREQIEARVIELFPLINIEEITVQTLSDNHTIQFSIVYSINSYGINDTVNINLQ
jgi:phage baseplate assembly protein W